MSLLDRYLLAVKIFLPRAQQDDIVKELSEDIRSRIEDMETERGRPLSEAELETLIKGYGHPALLAGRYGPRRRLIGPEIFPFYWFVLRLALVAGALVHIVIGVARLASGEPEPAMRQVFFVLPMVAFVQFGIITLVFATLDHYGTTALQGRWNPHNLPAADAATPTVRLQPIFQLVTLVVFSFWWFTALRFPYLIFGPLTAVLTFAPVWQVVYVPMLSIALVDIALQCVVMARPQWTRFRAVMRLAIGVASVVVIGVLMKASELVVLTEGAELVPGRGRLISIVNDSILVSLAIAAVITVVTVVMEFWRGPGRRQGAALHV